MERNIEILDSTLRDGSQGEGISYSVQDKIHISDKWELTPALRYSHYKGITQQTPAGKVTECRK